MIVQLPPPVHGAALMNQRAVKAFESSACYDLTVHNITTRTEYASLGHISPLKILGTCVRLARIFWDLARIRPHIVYLALVPTGAAFLRDAFIVTVLKLLRFRRVFHLHGKGVSQASSKWGALSKWLYAWVFDGADVILLSHRLKEDVLAVSQRVRLHVVPNGLEDPGPPAAAVVSNLPTILFLSNIVESKGPLLLLEALGALNAEGVPFRAVFAGLMREPLGPERFAANVRRFGLEGRVEYLGAVYGPDKLSLLNSADVFAFPTFNDTQPIVILEAMAAGKAIISTDEGAIPDMISHRVSGLIVPRMDTGALTQGLRELILSGALRSALGAEARRTFEMEYTLERFQQRLVEAVT